METNDFNPLTTSLLRACDQILMLSHEMKDIQVRLDRAQQNGQWSWIYTMEMKISVMYSIRNIMCLYVAQLAEDLQLPQRHLIYEPAGIYETSEDHSDDAAWN